MSKINLFISYSHQEKEKYLPELLTYLNTQSCPNINIWYDENISPGVDWDDTIKSSFESSQIVLLLISQSFLMSEYIRNNELNPALERFNTGKCKVVPIFIRSCSLQNYPEITKLQGLPKGMKFISNMGEEKWGHYTDIVQKINDMALEILTDNNITTSIADVGDDHKTIVAKKIEQLRTSNKIFLSVPDSEEGMKKRQAFLCQVEGKIKYESWPYEIVPDWNDAKEVMKLAGDDQAQLLSSFINDSIYSIHIISSEQDFEDGVNQVQYELAKKYASGAAMYRSIIWLINPDIKEKLNHDIRENPISSGSDIEKIFQIIEGLDKEKEKKITELKKDFTPGSKVFMFYDYSKDHDSDLRITLKSKIEEHENISVRSTAPEQNLEQEREEVEKCDGALIFYGSSDSKWFMMRQSILFDAKNIKAKAVCIDAPDIDKKMNRDVSKNEFQTIKGQNDLDLGVESFLERIQKNLS